jgi:23S rRNA (pseudouridine1915-N3)-methyltransferase
MKITILAFGKLKAPGLREAVDYYVRNSGAWASVNEVELKSLTVPDKSVTTRQKIQTKEAEILRERLSKILSPRGAYVLLDEKGKASTTLEWARFLKESEDASIPEIAFCIGSSLGFDPELRKKARAVLSFGPQTTSHEIARLLLAEQIYRALSVNHDHPYHNEG